MFKDASEAVTVTKHRSDIDGLRAIAILPVVLFHLHFTGFPGGFVGVDVFFVISGFLITGIISREIAVGSFSLVDFYERRIRRIFPVLFAVLIVVFGAGVIFLAPNNLQDLGKSEISAALFSSNVYFWRSIGYFEVSADIRPLLHTWSLAVEEQFYVFFPIFLILINPLARWRVPTLIVGVVISLLVATYLAHSPAGFYLLPSRAFELGIGALVSLKIFPAIKSKFIADILGLTGLASIFSSIGFLTVTAPFPGPWALLPTVGAGLVLYAGSEQKNAAANFLSLAPLRWIGLISYSAYMWHWPIIVATRFWIAGPITTEVAAALVIVIFIVAAVSFKFIERPFRSKSILGRRTIFVMAFGAIVVVTAAGGMTWATKGFPERFPFGPTPLGAESMNRHQCFLDFGDRPEDWSPKKCTIEIGKPTGETGFIWGDSFAAHYVPGIEHLGEQGLNLRLIQATFAACPPFVDDAQRLDLRCANFNQRVGQSIDTLRPKTVLLAASWSHDEEAFANSDKELEQQLDKTVGFLRKAGVQNIALIGETPRYYLDVEQLNLRPGPGIARPRDDVQFVRRNAFLEQVAERLSIRYLAADRVLCSKMGCRIRDDDGHILQWDDAHLTYLGSNFMAEQFLAPFLFH